MVYNTSSVHQITMSYVQFLFLRLLDYKIYTKYLLNTVRDLAANGVKSQVT